ncbi:PH domain-containing protein [Flavobacterium glaciei]|uniref:Membrane protein n=1 Tax=Flavobacterium glaciei TaxID=386300 RepID=A0A562PUM1_9FLAO|nr:PH domain-containing protein [Flavobacterium glaciei]RDI54952.1 putative membrane protein [Flavobacterium glaciei]TWI47860.1 putative membrane protein [Flavobacterium glaciei]
MRADFSQPQRQSSIGILVMFFYTLQQYARALWPMIVIWIFKFDEVNKLYFFLGMLTVFVSIGVVSYLKYLNFTFFLDSENEEFIITDGVFNKTKTAIQLRKIQQVNINQSFIQKLIGVYELDVDTAGSNKKEGAIKAISHELALELKSRLLENEELQRVVGTSETTLEETEQKLFEVAHPFIKISVLSLLKVGITSNYGKSIALLLIFFSTIFENLQNFGDESNVYKDKVGSYIDKNFVFQTILISILFLFGVVLVVNVVRIIFKYYDYKITRQKGSLLLSFGLLNTKSTIIKPEKVQITTVTRNYFQRKMGILELKIRQATSGEKEEQKSIIEIPGCSATERDSILKLLFHKIPEKGLMLQPNFRKLIFSVFLSIGLPLFGFIAVGYWLEPLIFEYIYLVPAYVVVIGLIQYFRFKNSRLFIHENFIIKQSGAWDISNDIIEPNKIQAITTSQLFWHKKLNIGSIILHTAGGNIAFQLGDYSVIKQKINLWLYEIETSDSNWM